MHLLAQLIAVSVDSQFSHLAWINTPRNKGGLGHMEIPMVADLTKQISADYGVLIEDAGIALRCGCVCVCVHNSVKPFGYGC